jgi:hypothetical protein
MKPLPSMWVLFRNTEQVRLFINTRCCIECVNNSGCDRIRRLFILVLTKIIRYRWSGFSFCFHTHRPRNVYYTKELCLILTGTILAARTSLQLRQVRNQGEGETPRFRTSHWNFRILNGLIVNSTRCILISQYLQQKNVIDYIIYL